MSLSLIAVFIPILLMPGHRRPAVPRIRGDAVDRHPDLAAGLAHRHADHVRLSADARRGAAFEGALGGVGRSGSSSASRRPIRARSPRCSTTRCWSACCWSCMIVLNVFLLRLLSVDACFRSRTTGFSSARSSPTRASPSRRWRRSSQQLQSHRADGPGGRLGHRIHRHPRAQHRQCLRRAQAPGAAQAVRRPGGRSACGRSSIEVSGARLFLQAVQDLHIGGRQSAAEYQYTLTSEDTAALYTWTPKLRDRARQGPQRDRGRELRPAAERPADLHQHRARHRDALRLRAEPDRQRALRCLRPAHRLHHLQSRSTSTSW